MTTAGKKMIAGGVLVVCLGALLYWKFGRGDNSTDSASPQASSSSTGATATGPNGSSASAPQKRSTIKGTITFSAAVSGSNSDSGNPLATVQLWPSDNRDELRPQTVRAGSAGAFEFANIQNGRYRLSATAPGYLAKISDEIVVASGGTETVSLALDPGGHTVSGLVSDITGGPVVGAAVRLTPTAGLLGVDRERSFATLTDEGGRFAVSAANGAFAVAASHPDYVSSTNTRIEVRGDKSGVELTLIPGGVIEGTVVSEASGEPAPFARVVYNRQSVSRSIGAMVRTSQDGGAAVADKNGRYRIRGVRAGSISLSAATKNARTTEPVVVPLAIAESVDGVDLFVESAFRISGTVRDSKGAPLADTTVAANPSGSDSLASRSVTTASDGTFVVGPVVPGEYALQVGGNRRSPFLGGPPPVRVEVVDADVNGVDLVGSIPVMITGRVEPAEVAEISVAHDRPGARVAALLSPSRAAADGTFEIGPVVPGQTVPLRAVSEDGRLGEIDVKVDQAGTSGVVIKLEPAGSVSGVLVDDSGKPVVGASISVASKKGNRTVVVNGMEVSARRSVTSDSGSFDVLGLRAGAYRLSAVSDRGETYRWAAGAKNAGTSLPQDLDLAEGERKAGLRLVVEAANESIEGIVVDKSGQAVPDVFVSLSPSMSFEGMRPMGRRGSEGPPRRRRTQSDSDDETDDDESGTMMMVVASSDDDSDLGGGFGGTRPPVVTDDKGRFVVSGLRRGTYDITAEDARGHSRAIATKVETGSNPRIELVPLTVLKGIVTAGGKPTTDFRVSLVGPQRVSRSFRNVDGTFVLRRLDPGDYTIEVESEAGRAKQPVIVVPGDETKVEIALAGQTKIRGRLVNPAGEPVAGVMILVTPDSGDGEVNVQISSGKPPPMSGPDGAFVTTALPGKYMLLGLSPAAGGMILTERITVGDGELDLGELKTGSPGGPGGPGGPNSPGDTDPEDSQRRASR